MRSSLLATLRGSDGRSLMRAVALLFGLAGILGAFQAAAVAAPAAGIVLCLTGSTGDADLPAHADHTLCIALGCPMGGGLAPLPERPQPPLAAVAATLPPAPVMAEAPPSPVSIGPWSARGPPQSV